MTHKDDWFRQPAIAEDARSAFEAKLARSRSSRHEYMRIQAGSLHRAGAHEAAIELVDPIIKEKPDIYCLAWLHEDKAACWRALGQKELAVSCYRMAIERTRSWPNVQGNAYLEFPFWVAAERMAEYYAECLDIVHEFFELRPLFPITNFKQHASNALIAAQSGYVEDAKPSARTALIAASLMQSNAANHRSLGLVGEGYRDVRRRLQRIAHGSVASRILAGIRSTVGKR